MNKDNIGDRMKIYENVPKLFLMKRSAVIVRLDGKAFHSFTKNMERPFDDRLIRIMQEVTGYLVKNVEGCKIGYTQSDEISLLLTDYTNLQTEAYFGNNLQKIVSITASMASVLFNKKYREIFNDDTKIALFDSRAFNLPKEEVVNYFIWRQQDCTRNSIQMVGRAYFSHKELKNVSCVNIQEMLFSKHNINFNDIDTYKKRGSCVYKVDRDIVIDKNIPIFTQDREFIQKYL